MSLQTTADNRTPPTAVQKVRRDELIDATLTVIADQGLSNLTLAKVAAGAGMTAGSVNFHFSSKEALLLETLRAVTSEFAAAMRDVIRQYDDDPAEALLRIVDANFDPSIADPRKVAVWYAFLAESRSRSDYLTISGERDSRYFQMIHTLFERLIGESGRQDELDADALASGFTGLIDGLWQDILFSADAFDRKHAIGRCRAYLRSVLPQHFAARPQAVPHPTRATRPTQDGVVETLPAWVYRSDDFFALEREHIFMPAWQLVCHQNEIPKSGDYATFAFLSERAVVLRGKDGAIRAFHNVCPHRGHAVAPDARGHCVGGAIQCPYHGWNFHFDGRLKAVSMPEAVGNIDKARFGLKPLDCEVWMGFVFVRFRSEGPGIAERMAPFAEEFAHYRTEDMVPAEPLWEEEHAVDWKNAIENYAEDYHFPTGHQGLAALMNAHYDREVTATGCLRLSHALKKRAPRDWSGRHYHKLLPDYPHLPEAQKRRWTYFGLFPNVFFDVYPESMDFFHVVPIGPGRMKLRSRSFTLRNPSRATKAALYLNTRINARVQDEDNDLTTSVQGGLETSAYRRGVLSRKEIAVKGFQDWIRARLPVADLDAPPANGNMAAQNRLMLAQAARPAPMAAE